MRSVKIVHSADFHFDTPFKEVLESQSKARKEELKEVFKNIIDFCNSKNVDILLMAGDIFDNYTVNRETLLFIEQCFKSISNVKVFISPGNHDPFSNNSFYKLVNWPDNVYIFKGALEKVSIKELGVNIYGAAFNSKYERNSLISKVNSINKKDNNEINIMVIHGEISNSKDGNEYNPITLREIEHSNMDYIALGHRHSFSGIKHIGSTSYAYSGCPQGRGFDETGDKGIIYGDVYSGGTNLTFVKTSKRNYEEKIVNITRCNTYEEIRKKIIESIDNNLRNINLYKIILKGEINSNFIIDEDILESRLKDDFYFCKVKDKTSYKYDFKELSKGYSIKSIFIKKMIKKLDNAETDEEKDIILTAIKYGIRALSNEEVILDDY